MPQDERSGSRRKSARLTALISAAVVLGMTGLSFAAVPLYRRFCQVTGFDGTVRKAEAKPSKVLGNSVHIRFDANVRGLDWDFHPDQVSQTGLAFFHVINHSDRPITGHAAYNVVPEAVGRYFNKLQCFCFTDQTLQPGQSVDFPVVYFVDPAYAKDPSADDGEDITLSYTFFPVGGSIPGAKAAEGDISTAKDRG
jgi:cytochrome c oxidase assembly protein subunit 11